MPELVKNDLSFEPLPPGPDDVPRRSKERYLFLALTSLLAINLVVIFGALTFYYLLVRR
ncbi:MAG: hypothetical protein ACJ74Y_18200 [Bryobacteraceae bacterium]